MFPILLTPRLSRQKRFNPHYHYLVDPCRRREIVHRTVSHFIDKGEVKIFTLMFIECQVSVTLLVAYPAIHGLNGILRRKLRYEITAIFH